MNKIVRKEQFSEKVFLFEIEAPLIAKSRKAGNFVIVRVDKKGERMPLTIAGADIEKGTITLVVQMVGLSSKKLCALGEGDFVADVVGPLGNPTRIEKYGTVVCAGGGLGVAPMLPIIQALKAAGNRVLSVMAGRSKDLIILEDKVRESSDEVIIMTDDGSYGEKGVVTVGMEKPSARTDPELPPANRFVNRVKAIVMEAATKNGQKIVTNTRAWRGEYVFFVDGERIGRMMDDLMKNHEEKIVEFLRPYQKCDGVTVVAPFIGKLLDMEELRARDLQKSDLDFAFAPYYNNGASAVKRMSDKLDSEAARMLIGTLQGLLRRYPRA